MAIDEDAINDALNTPTEDLDQQDDQYEEPDDQYDDQTDDADEQPEEEQPDEVAALLDTTEKPRAENRVQRLANERREERERAERAERELAEYRARAQIQENDAARRAAEDRQRMLDEMDPTERRLYNAEQEARQARFEAADGRDATQFAALVAQHPQMKGLATEVEQELARARAAGQNPQRAQVAQFLLGQRAFKALQEGPKKAKAAKQRVDAARGRPMGAGSNASAPSATGKGSSLADMTKRLEGVKL